MYICTYLFWQHWGSNSGPSAFFALVIFQVEFHIFCLGLASDCDSTTYTSYVGGITDMYHCVCGLLVDVGSY
jgi:hypothetical protein